MFTIKGDYNTATVYAEYVEETAREQIRAMCSLEFLRDSVIRIMPDVHAGKGCTIGTTMTVKDAVVPSFVGVDIGCGMEVTKLEETSFDPAALDAVIRASIPSGFRVRETPHRDSGQIDLSTLRCASAIDLERALRSLGTLGGGNHFIEADRDDEGSLWLVIHSGSRHAGVETAEYYQNEAWKRNRVPDRGLIERWKAEGRQKEISRLLEEEKKKQPLKQYAFCTGDLLEDYLHDMEIMQRYAALNRRIMTAQIMEQMGWHAAESFTTIHNYIDTEHMILRKGAVSAERGERLIIPLNMRDGSLICTGLGNPEWNCSAPHGAGRLFSRSGAVQRFTLEEFREAMTGIYSSTVSAGTLDESPMAYKPAEEIMRCIGGTAAIERIIRPVYNYKAN